jgi:hypothetical protein
MEGKADLPKVVGALGARGGIAHLLDGGENQAEEDGDNGDDHEQFDECERAACGGSHRRSSLQDETPLG